MEEFSESVSPSIVVKALIGFAILAMVTLLGYGVWGITSFYLLLASIEKVPFVQATAIVTSKDNDQRLSIKSTDLPKGGDVVSVDQFVYGAISSGDRVCVQYKSISDDPQYATDFLNKGSCQK